MAVTIVSGVRARAAVSTNREATFYAEGIALMERWRNPLTLLAMRLATFSSTTIDVNHFEDELNPYLDTIDGAHTAADTTFAVDNIALWNPGDLWRSRDGGGEQVLVLAKDASLVEVERAVGLGSAAAALIDGDEWMNVSNAFEQGHPLPNIVSTTDVMKTNWCQEIRTPFGISEKAKETRYRGTQEKGYQEGKKATEHMEKIEKAIWYGRGEVGTKDLFDSGEAKPNLDGPKMNGVNTILEDKNDPDLLEDQTDLTLFELMDHYEKVFNKGGKQSSKEKIHFVPGVFRTFLDNVGISKMQTFAGQTLMGIPVARWVSSHGTIFFATHDLFDRGATTQWYDTFVLDPKWINYVTFGANGNTRKRFLDPYGATGATVEQGEYMTTACIMLKHALTHSRLRVKTFSF